MTEDEVMLSSGSDSYYTPTTPEGASTIENDKKKQRSALKRLFTREPEILFREAKFIRKVNDNPSGEVWYGRCRDTDVAIRKVKWEGDPQKVDQLRGEIGILRKIASPNIALFLGGTIHHGSLYIYSEYAEDSLRTYLSRRHPEASLTERLNLLYEASLGMLWLHSTRDARTGAPGIVHRHVKTSCFLVFDHGRTKVCDFALSTYWGEEALRGSAWTAPEVRSRASPFSFAADVYSFGLVMIEALSGSPGFEPAEGQNLDECIAALRWSTPAVASLIRACVSADPAKRPTFATIVETLERTISMLLIPNELSAKWWNEKFNSKEEVDWKEFEEKYKCFGDSARGFSCLRYFLVPNLAANKVTRTRFGDFITRVCDKESDWKRLAAIAESLVDKMWFHGYLSINEAVSIAANSKPGSFLVRFSSSVGGFSITYLMDDGSIKHTKVMHANGRYYYGNAAYSSLDKLLKANSAVFKLPLYSQSLRSIVNGMDTIPSSYSAHLQTAQSFK